MTTRGRQSVQDIYCLVFTFSMFKLPLLIEWCHQSVPVPPSCQLMMSGIKYKYIVVVTQIVYEIDILLYSNNIQHMHMHSHVYKHTHTHTHACTHADTYVYLV